MLWAILPAGLILVNFVFWLFVACFKANMMYLKREFIATLVILYFLIHPDLVKHFFFALSCREIEPEE